MQIAKNTVVTLTFELLDAQGNMIEKAEAPIVYLHGGFQGIFPLVEQALDGKKAGDSCEVRLAPNDAFGEYDAYNLWEAPDNVSMAAVAIAIGDPMPRNGLATPPLDFEY